MATVRTTLVRVEVETGTSAERELAEWLRRWRRRGVRRDGKPSYPHQGASMVLVFHAPEAAIADLERGFAGSSSAVVTRVPADAG
ncbi:hypothetical protein [Nannocystis bainbridge]|uniref:Uncharacterized protein n=1 Tax=Nannocystis bainbridge TaxID=2995303 RepID=A0ABT5DW81_9BACT|nr:hypothetical protein [Nannocystis bainbridge]MDC0716672.1 hypothetical protein [Nannocystis bainbridge]